MFCLVRLRFGLAMFGLDMFCLAKFGSKINGIGFSEAAHGRPPK